MQCNSGEVEDLSHFILTCVHTSALRLLYIPRNETLENIINGRTYLKNLSIFISKAFLCRT